MGHRPSEGKRDSPRTPVSILLVDDTPAKLLTYEVMLGELGEKLIKVGSVEEAFAVLLKSDVALVITDVAMPDVDGFEFAKQLRGHPRFESTPIIFVSAMAHSEHDQLHGYASGAVDYVTAPVVPEVLRAKVKVFADLYRKQRELEALKAELETRVAARTSELAASEARYRTLVDGANDIVATLDLKVRFTSVNPVVERILGYAPEEVIGASLSKFVPEDQLAVYADMLKRKLEGDQSTRYEIQLLAKDGKKRFTLEVNSKLMFDGEGRPVGIHSISRDISERKEAEARQLVLIRELQHRTKNLIAVVQSIATNTLARSPDLSSANAAIVGRLHALARAQEFVASGPGGGVPLRDLIEAELSAFATRFEADGIPLVVGGAFAQQFALVVHELATNAAKYGALSTPSGRLLVAWHVDEEGEEPRLNFSWVERDGPRVQAPAEEGFGTRLISASLNGTSSVSYAETGLEFRADVPLTQIMFGKNGSG
jgi:PAS domain S-box-containing protein